jgi:hypothetical protein
MQGVYLFGNRELGWFKIGKSRNIENRFKDLCCVLPFPIEQIEIFECDDPGFVEVQLHRHFASKRMRGEWPKKARARAQRSRESKRLSTLSNQASR